MAQIIEINSLEEKGAHIFSSLTEAQLRNRLEPEKGIFIAESPKVIGTALDNGFVPVAMLTEKKHIEGQAKSIIERCGDIPLYTAETEILSKLTGFQLTRGVLCAMKRPMPKKASEICEGAKRVAVLEGIVDSTNTGAIFRSAAALGIDAVLLTKTCSDPLVRRSVRVSMGTVFQVPWTYLSDDYMTEIAEMGFRTAAMALSDDSVSIDDEKLKKESRLAIVLGTEGDGLCKTTISKCDYTVKIPMLHGVDSLNVAAASAVAFWELRGR